MQGFYDPIKFAVMMCSNFRAIAHRSNGYAELNIRDANSVVKMLAIGVGEHYYATERDNALGKPETLELWVHTRVPANMFDSISSWADIMGNKRVDKDEYYVYHFAYLPAGLLEDIWRSLMSAKIKENDEPVSPTPAAAKYFFSKLYDDFEKMYNPYPVQMSRAEAFTKALENGLINEDCYNAARNYYGSLWNYVGD